MSSSGKRRISALLTLGKVGILRGLKAPQDDNSWSLSRIPTSLDAELLDFLVVVLAVEDVPLLAAFQDGAALGLDFAAGFLVDLLLRLQQIFQQAPDFEAKLVLVARNFHPAHAGQRLGDGAGQHVDLLAADAIGLLGPDIDAHYSTALYLRTSSFFTFLNISW